MAARTNPPQLRELLAVIPVGRTETHGDWSVTCLAVECYDDGVRVTFRVFGTGHARYNPELALVVADDRGGSYYPWGGGGTGAANWKDCDWRMGYNCTPALDPQARELRLMIAGVQQLREHDETGHRPAATAPHPGPWEFVVPL